MFTTTNRVGEKDDDNVKPHFEDVDGDPTTRASLEIAEREASDDRCDRGPQQSPPWTTTTNGADPNALYYLLSGRDAAPFTINSETGQISTSAALDHETKPTYSVIVTAVDPSGASARITVTITVTDVDEVPDLVREGAGGVGERNHRV